MLDNNENSIFAEIELPQHDSSNNWMVSFADLISLLLVFFILIYSMNEVQKPSWDKVKESIVTKFNSAKKLEGAFINDNFGATKFQMSRGIDMDYLYAVMNNKLKDYAGVAIENGGDKMVISLKKSEIFAGEKLNQDDKAQAILYAIGDGLQGVRNKIEVVEYYNKKSDDARSTAIKQTAMLASEIRKYGNSSRLDALANYSVDNSAVNDDKVMIILHDGLR